MLNRGSKIDNLHNVSLIEGLIGVLKEEILWLQVSMHDFAAVAIDDCRENLSDNLGCHFLGEHTAVNDLIEQLTTLAVLCDQIEVISILVVLKQPHDVGMLKLGKDLILLVLVDAFLLLKSRLFYFLNGSNLVRPQVNGLGDFSKATLTDYFQRLEVLHDIAIGDVSTDPVADLILGLLVNLLRVVQFVHDF